jgi:NAD(P)-dependent dehydrogenase (short-subunit alcohol dehydrogenase family)
MSRANGRKAIFITGAASGMGLETARLFASNGWYVGGVDVNKDGLRALEQELGWDNCLIRELDVTDRDAYRQTLADFAEATDGKLDVLFNNAGIGRGGPFADMSWEDAMAVININLVAVLSGIHLAIPLLKATPGSLCFSTSSSSAIFGIANIAVYSATKHAVKGFTEALITDLRLNAPNVTCSVVMPGHIGTSIALNTIRASYVTYLAHDSMTWTQSGLIVISGPPSEQSCAQTKTGEPTLICLQQTDDVGGHDL